MKAISMYIAGNKTEKYRKAQRRNVMYNYTTQRKLFLYVFSLCFLSVYLYEIILFPFTILLKKRCQHFECYQTIACFMALNQVCNQSSNEFINSFTINIW